MIILSILLIFGVKRDIRGLMLPWVYASYVAILFQAMYGLWMVFGYYIYLEMVFSALCNFTWMGLNIYCIMVVKSHVRNVKLFQSPDIEYYQDIWKGLKRHIYFLWNIHFLKGFLKSIAFSRVIFICRFARAIFLFCQILNLRSGLHLVDLGEGKLVIKWFCFFQSNLILQLL